MIFLLMVLNKFADFGGDYWDEREVDYRNPMVEANGGHAENVANWRDKHEHCKNENHCKCADGKLWIIAERALEH